MNNTLTARKFALISLFSGTFLLSGCATTGEPDKSDPLEGMNRAVHSFNTGFDDAIGKPVSRGYKAIAPAPVDKGISNFFGNIGDVGNIFNNLLQLKVGQAVSDTGRILVNSTAGMLGFIDVASSVGLNKHDEDFGQTLGSWGVGSGPYLVLPFLGPSSFRDTAGILVDSYVDPLYQIDDIPARNAMIAIKLIDTRADLLSATNILEQAALDPYLFVRDAYLQRREYLVNDGVTADPEFD